MNFHFDRKYRAVFSRGVTCEKKPKKKQRSGKMYQKFRGISAEPSTEKKFR